VLAAASMPRVRTAVALAAMLTLASCPACNSNHGWQSLESPRWKFSVEFPGEVSEEPQETFAEFGAASENANFRIMCSKVPRLPPKESRAELLSMRDGSADSLHATVAESKIVDVQGQPAIEFTLEFTVEGEEMASHTRYVRCRNHLYQLIVTAPATVPAEEEVRKFFDSFRIEKSYAE
jgi:hypothetical protein